MIRDPWSRTLGRNIKHRSILSVVGTSTLDSSDLDVAPTFHVHSFHPLWVRSFQFFSALVLVKAAKDFSLVLSVRRALHDVLMALRELHRGELFACVQHAHSRAARGLLPGPARRSTTCTSSSCSGKRPVYGCDRGSCVPLRPPGLDPAEAESRLLSRGLQLRFCSFRSRCSVGHVPHGQWALLDSDTLALIDQSASLVEPCACACRTKRSSRSAHGCLRELRRGSLSSRLAVLAPASFWV